MPRVSIILPTYNRAHLIKRPIKSVLNQEFQDFELIIVDDGSTDNTAAVVDGFNDSRISYIEHEINRGGSAARNTGITAATGDYISFLDSDDKWHPTKLTEQVNCLDYCSDEWVAAYCDIEVVRTGRSARIRALLDKIVPGRSRQIRVEGGEELIPYLLTIKFDPGGASTLIVRRNVVDQLDGFDESFRRHQDWEFLIRLLQVGKLAHVAETLVYKYETSYPSVEEHLAGKKELFEKFGNEIINAEKEGHDVIGIHKFDLALYYFLNGDLIGGFQNLKGATINIRTLVWAILLGISKKIPLLRYHS